MNEMALKMLARVREALPGANVYWEKDPLPETLKGSSLTAELKDRKFTIQFDTRPGNGSAQEQDGSLVEEVVDDFVDFFERSIYRKEKFTRLI